ncbi:O-antigen ligase family protein [Microbacterium amylolyticum]|uniref:Membrane protein (GlpM family) n=2 Tax=Microbacterium amylolyticum TaxID=936337 RepID=A0ABS4ZGV0_9MICO|nr:O-antigen ligase family protein [Microbacterium amylolyticum]MBP2436506.1 putative membrane protein (GlpM family) [Microbacterium amylolyticum]
MRGENRYLGVSPLLGAPSFLDSFSTIETILILGLVALAGFSLAAIAFRLRPRWMLAGTLVLAVVQFFGPFGFTSLGLLATCALLPGVAWRFWRQGAGVWGWLLASLTVWQLISTLWAEKIGSAGYGVVLSVAGLVSYLLARELMHSDRAGIPWALAVVAPVIIAQATLTVIFRLSPDAEYAYLTSRIATIFTEPGVEEVISGAWPNVMDPDKAGGVFLNGNTASLFFAVTACLFVWTAASKKLVALHIVTAGVSFIAMLATGSKTPYALVLVVPLVALFLVLAVRKPREAIVVASSGLVLASAAATAVVVVRPGILSQTARTLSERFGLWQMVGDAVPERWFTGFGYGNWREWVVYTWDDYFPHMGPQVWPPHNLFLQAWVDAGLIALALTIALVTLPIVASIRRIAEAHTAPLLSAVTVRRAIVFAGLVWVLFHGMADTTSFLGDNHTIPFVAILTAVALAPRPAERSATP